MWDRPDLGSLGLETSPRQIRVFVSSTFADMHAERDELVKRVFPAVRELCDARGVSFIEVDLRWGVTDKQVAEGEMLGICLSEIDQCRPYFIGLLGERYGWVPDEFDPALVHRYPWLAEHVGASVTELEIVHGVLAKPDSATDARFYFRAESNQRTDVSPRANALKERIRTAGLTVRDGYADAVALGELVQHDLIQLVEERFPSGSEPSPLELETLRQYDFMRARADVYVGRDAERQFLDEHERRGGQPLVVTGPPGIGKSALLASWARERPGAFVHFTAASPSSTDWSVTCRRLLAQLIDGGERSADLPDDPVALRAALVKALRNAGGGDRLVIVLDGLDQLVDRTGAVELDWLPAKLPVDVRIVASAQPGRALDAMQRRGWQTLEVAPLSPVERAELTRAFLSQHAKTLPDRELAELLAAPQTESPLFLRLVLEELRVHGSRETLRPRLEDLLSALDTPSLLAAIFRRWEADYERDRPGLVIDSLRLLSAARSGLSEPELLDLLGTCEKPLPQAMWAPLRRAAGGVLAERSGRLTFAHHEARNAVAREYIVADRLAAADHARLAAYFGAMPLTSPRRIEEQSWQLAAAKNWPGLHAALTDVDLADTLYSARPFEFRELWTTLEAESGHALADAYPQIAAHPSDHSLEQAWFVARMFLRSGHPDRTLETYAHVEQLARRRDDDHLLQQALRDHGIALRQLGRLDEALTCWHEQEAICRRRGDDEGLGMALANQVASLVDTGDPSEALRVSAEHRTLCEQDGDREGVEASLVNDAYIQKRRGQYKEADLNLRAAERIARDRGDLDAVQLILGNQAASRMALGEIDEALELLAQQEELCRRSGDQLALAGMLGNRATAIRTRGEFAAASAIHAEQESICREIGDECELQSALGDHGLIVMGLGDPDRAMAMFEEQERLCRKLGLPGEIARSLGLQALVHSHRGNSLRALELHRVEADAYRELRELEGLARAIGNQARVHRARGELAEALSLHAEEQRLCDELDSPSMRARAYGNQAETRRLLRDLDAAEALYKRQASLARELRNPDALRTALGGRAAVAHDRGDLGTALELSREATRIVRELGLPDVELAELDVQAQILLEQEDYAEVLTVYRTQEEIARRAGDDRVLAASLFNMARLLVVTRTGNPQPLIDEAVTLAAKHGLTDIERAAARLRRGSRWLARLERLTSRSDR
jgi:tetratricopeptide (TPR) repeat protein